MYPVQELLVRTQISRDLQGMILPSWEIESGPLEFPDLGGNKKATHCLISDSISYS